LIFICVQSLKCVESASFIRFSCGVSHDGVVLT